MGASDHALAPLLFRVSASELGLPTSSWVQRLGNGAILPYLRIVMSVGGF